MPLGSAMQSFFASIRNLITAIFVGAPEGMDVSKYTFQVTALISSSHRSSVVPRLRWCVATRSYRRISMTTASRSLATAL
jgi:hypothetical protein